VREKADSWWHGVSPSSLQDRLDSALHALKTLADAGLGAASVLANLHHRRIIPLMERRLRIFEMHEGADPVVLAQSRLLPDLLPQEYAATRARRTINLKAVRNDDVARRQRRRQRRQRLRQAREHPLPGSLRERRCAPRRRRRAPRR
jgi:hypothetical protein